MRGLQAALCRSASYIPRLKRPDNLDNAAPLCGSCHDLFGRNPDKRKQIREMRDFWWEVCEKRNANPDVVALNLKLDAIQNKRALKSGLSEPGFD